MADIRDAELGGIEYFYFAVNDTGGSGADATTQACYVRRAGDAGTQAPFYSFEATLLAEATYPAGYYEAAMELASGTGYAAGTTYGLFVSAGVDAETPGGHLGVVKVKAAGESLDDAISRILGISSGTSIHANVKYISDDPTAAENLELDYDGTGYDKSASSIGTTAHLGEAVTVGTNNDKTGYDLNSDQTAVTVGTTALVAGLTDAAKAEVQTEVEDGLTGHDFSAATVGTTIHTGDMRGTDSAALASFWTADRAGYVDELAAANIPADIGSLADKIGAVDGSGIGGQEYYSLTGLLRLILMKNALAAPGALGATYDPAADSLEAHTDVGVTVNALANNVVTAASIATGALTAAKFGAAYYPVVRVLVDSAADNYTVVILDVRDMSVVTPTAVTIKVDADGGANLFTAQAMTRDADTGAYYYASATQMSGGTGYTATIVATIGGADYTFEEPIGRDVA